MSQNNVNAWLRSQKPIKIKPSLKKLQSVKAGDPSSHVGVTVIPALNAQLNFTKAKLKAVNPKKLQGVQKPPKEFKNHDPNSKDPRFVLSTPPGNQSLCGSCFAFSSATAISDVFVFSGLSFNPNISPMSLLSCADLGGNFNNGCEGGNPAELLNYISIDNNPPGKGAMSNYCTNYDDQAKACGDDMGPQGSSSCSYSTPNGQVFTNSMIPNCGCCGDSFKHYQYNIKNVTLAYRNGPNDDATVNLIKNHIMEYGVAVTGFAVLENFPMGQDWDTITESTNGVYMVQTYNNGVTSFTSYDGNSGGKVHGGHAVAIVGWGEEQNTNRLEDSNGIVQPTIPFWWVRNSWKQEWGTKMNGVGGYFKYAMGTYNTGYNMEDLNSVPPFDQIGGIILFEPANTENNNESTVECIGKEPDFKEQEPNYIDYNKKNSQDPSVNINGHKDSVVNGDGDDSGKSKDDNKTLYYILAVLLAIIIIILIFKA
jgi:hypothetical protein